MTWSNGRLRHFTVKCKPLPGGPTREQPKKVSRRGNKKLSRKKAQRRGHSPHYSPNRPNPPLDKIMTIIGGFAGSGTTTPTKKAYTRRA